MSMENVVSHINENSERYIEELKDYLRIPSISTDPERKNDIRKCADFTAEEMRRIGLENVQLIETDGHPAVFGEWIKAKDAPTVLIYGHYDVQPVDPVELWTTGPFEPDVRKGYIYARGAVDDKGQVFVHFKGLQAHLSQNGSLPVNVKVLIEGEEEIGSPNLAKVLRDYRDLLKADLVLVSDTSMYGPDVPSLVYGLRGLAYVELELTGPNRDLHSGSFGGAVDNPCSALCWIITQLKDRNGRILIPGFYDDVLELTEKEKNEFAKLPFDEADYRAELGVDALFGEQGYTTLERTWARPTLEINGIWGGYTGKGAKTVLPSKAFAKVSMRLVANQDPRKIIEQVKDYLNQITPKTVKLKIHDKGNAGRPALTPIDSPGVRAAYAAVTKAFGKEPVFQREGGSIPIVESFKQILGLDTVLMGFGLPTENAHSPDENLKLSNYQNGILSSAFFLDELARIS